MFTHIHRLTNNKQQQADLHKKYHILDWIKFMTTIITCSPTPTPNHYYLLPHPHPQRSLTIHIMHRRTYGNNSATTPPCS